jgi:hypothetical protein
MASRNVDDPRQRKIASGIDVRLGPWLIVSPWLFGFAVGAGRTWNSIVVGMLVAVIAAIRQAGAPRRVA